MKRVLVIAAALVLFADLGIAVPKVAVLDAVLPEGMANDIAIGVTEKISEKLVSSGRFIVLDRTTVAQSLKEIEFQMSGLVSDAELRKARDQLGSRLGASFVVVIQVTQISETYFISAKMIDIATGEITIQASAQEEGKASVTLKLADLVGNRLAAVSKGVEEAAPGEALGRVPMHSHLLLACEISFPWGESVDKLDNFVIGSFGGNFGTFTPALSLHWAHFLHGGMYLSVSLDDAMTVIRWLNISMYQFDFYFNTMQAMAGAGWGFPLGSRGQLYTGVRLGAILFGLGSIWRTWVPSQTDTWAVGPCTGAEIGYDLVLSRHFALASRVSFTLGGFPSAPVGTPGYLFNSPDSHFIGFWAVAVHLGAGWLY